MEGLIDARVCRRSWKRACDYAAFALALAACSSNGRTVAVTPDGGGASKGNGGQTAAEGAAGMRSDGGVTGSGGKSGTGGTANGGAGGSRSSSGGATLDSGGSKSVGDAAIPAPDAAILPCADIAVGGGWQKITPPGDLGDTQAIALDPFEVGTIYVQMHKGGNGNHFTTDGIYKSRDCGSTWSVLPPGRNATDVKDAMGNAVNIHAGSIVSLIVDPVDRGVMYTASNYGPPGIYKSTNGGVDWDQLIPDDLKPYMLYGGWFNALSVDPTDHDHLIGSTHTGCMGMYAPNCLAETRDAGATWRLIPAPESGNEQCGPYIHDATTLMYASGQQGAWVTTDDRPDNPTPTWKKISQGANGADTGLLAYRATDGKYYVGSDYGVLIGSSDFTDWTLDTSSPRPIPFIVGTGRNLFASSRSDLYSTAKEATPMDWSKLAAGGTPPKVSGRWLVYDDAHHLLYSSSWGDGLYRLATP